MQSSASPETIDQTPPAEPPHHKRIKIVLIFLGTLLAILILSTAFLNGQIQPIDYGTQPFDPLITTVETASGWKTYRNEEYRFEFEYPHDWLVNKNPSGTYDTYSIMSSDYTNHPTSGVTETGAILIMIKREPPGSTFDSDAVVKEQKYISGNNITIYKVSGAGIHGTDYIASIPHANENYNLHLSFEQSRKAEFEKIFNQILSTFRFIE